MESRLSINNIYNLYINYEIYSKFREERIRLAVFLKTEKACCLSGARQTGVWERDSDNGRFSEGLLGPVG
jgi:hypothetical protein